MESRESARVDMTSDSDDTFDGGNLEVLPLLSSFFFSIVIKYGVYNKKINSKCHIFKNGKSFFSQNRRFIK